MKKCVLFFNSLLLLSGYCIIGNNAQHFGDNLMDTYKTKPAILITGGTGYIGSHTAWLAAQKGYTVIILDQYIQEHEFDHDWALCIKGDYADQEILSTIFTRYAIEAVMHFAAYIEVGESVKDPLKFYKNNVAKTMTLLETMLAHDVKKIIFSSSCAVYGDPQWLPLSEDHPKNPVSPYGRTKLMIEMMLEDLHRAHGLQFVSLRYFNASGAMAEYNLGERHTPETHIIPLLLRAAKSKKPFYIFGSDYPTNDGTCIRDYLHVRDLASAHLCALDHLNKGGISDYFNLGTGHGISVKKMVEAVERICGEHINIIMAERRPGDPPILVADPSHVHTILQWKPQYSDLDYILKTAYAFENN